MKSENKPYTAGLDFDRDSSIDESALDVEWLDQASLTMRYGRYEADCRKDLDHAKAKLEIVEAELDQDIRTNPEKYGLEKITETAISKVITNSPEQAKAQEKVREAAYELNMAQAAMKAIYAKKDALENLVRLHGQQYFAGPSIPRNLSKEWEDRAQQKKSDKKIKIKQRTTKRKRTK